MFPSLGGWAQIPTIESILDSHGEHPLLTLKNYLLSILSGNVLPPRSACRFTCVPCVVNVGSKSEENPNRGKVLFFTKCFMFIYVLFGFCDIVAIILLD